MLMARLDGDDVKLAFTPNNSVLYHLSPISVVNVVMYLLGSTNSN